MDIGLMGGTFDPIHLGHLIIAEAVREKLSLSKVIFIPAGQPWLKADRKIAAGEHRLEMVSLAIKSNPHFEVSTAELARKGPSYTVDTVTEMKRELGLRSRLYFIVGADALADISRWKDPDRMSALCQIIGVNRPGAQIANVESLKSILPEISSCIQFVEVPQIDISSSEIRERVKKGLSIRYMVPSKVEDYIYQNRLYL